MSDYLGKDTPKLGFGLMRLPKKGPFIDAGRVAEMVDMFIEAGFTYFDTAYVYIGSESTAKKALVDRHPREKFTLASKLNTLVAPNETIAKKQFITSLERTGAGYFDYYLLHSLMDNNVAKYDKFRLWDFVQEQKAKGLIKHIGFSFHAGPKLLDRLLTEHPEVEFVQLQINYADWENPAVTSRENYEVARKHNKPIVVMEPVKGGKLADPPKEVTRLFKSHNPSMSPSSWAIRFAASLEGVLTVLSGMSNIEQMRDNISFMKDFRPLDNAEQNILREARRVAGQASDIPCTRCGYCVEGCPQGINIPDIFAAMNARQALGQIEKAAREYALAVGPGHHASDCLGCKKCESACPQHIPITKYLSQCAECFDE